MDKGMNRGKMWGLLALVLAIGLMGSALAGGSALAAKGGNGGKHVGGGTTSGYGTCSVTPNPVAQGAQSTINGSGFAPNASLTYFVLGSGGTQMGFVGTDATGSFSTTAQFGWLGTNTVSISGGGSCTLQVV